MSLQVGQKLWFVSSNNRRDESEVTVWAVGRKWATLDNRCRISLVDLRADAGEGVSPGRAWLSQSDYEADKRLRSAWDSFRAAVDRKWTPPDGVTEADIAAARAALKLQPAGKMSALTALQARSNT